MNAAELTFETELVACRKCGTMTDELAIFPGKICLDCHSKRFDEQVRKNGGILPRPDFSKAVRV